jgi:histidinol dehydrogenase
MKIIEYKKVTSKKIEELLKRPAVKNDAVLEIVKPILEDVKKNGGKAVLKYAKKYDGLKGNSLLIEKREIKKASAKLSKETKSAIDIAAANIKKFHSKQLPKEYSIVTMPGVKCFRKYSPIENVGLYIPGGSAILFSTMLMLGIPAKIAGCKRVIVSSPLGGKEIEPALAYSILKCGVDEVYNIGGAQAIAMMAYGTEYVKKVDKIFGPGNQYVTSAKSIISADSDACAIDMPAGPSEVLVIADESADPKFVASDLLSQAEHGADSQVVLLTTNKNIAEEVLTEINNQLNSLPRKLTAQKSLKNSVIIIVPSIYDAIELSNYYAPEHLILSTGKADKIINRIKNAGSVFIGNYSPESVGDYASGTNHSLPTYGYAKSYSGVNVESFMKAITFQKLSKKGLKNISAVVINLAETEKLQAHANAVKIRLAK